MRVVTKLEMLRGDGRKQAGFRSDVAWEFSLSVPGFRVLGGLGISGFRV